MKKTLLLSLALALSISVFAQNRGTLLKESFDSIEMPDGWKITGNNSQNWSVSESQMCGGKANEMKLNWEPTFYNGFTRLTSPKVDLTGIDSVLISFKHYVDVYSVNPCAIGVATSTDGSSWSICYEKISSSDGRFDIYEVISNEDMGKDDVMFCLYFKGHSTNINAVYFDDIELNTVEDINAKITSVDVPNNINAGDNNISFSMQNLGVEKITYFEASYEINGINYTQTFETEIAFTETKQFTFDQGISLNPNKYEVVVNVSSINKKEDKDPSNNTLSKDIFVSLGSTQRKPMIEHFSSSSCIPCVSVNNLMHTLTNENPGKYTYTKYPVKYPTDIYNTIECVERGEYYNVTSAPNVILDGVNYGPTSISQYQLDESYNTTAFVDIKGAFDIDGKTINVTADVMSYIDLENAKAYISVNEKTTTGNVGDNGETEFHHILMKMLNDANGNDININIGESQRLEFTYDMTSTNVEEMTDLEVAVWIQNPTTGEVFNSNYLYEYTEHPYPARNLTLTENDNNIQITWDAPEKGNPTGYNVYINNELALNNSTELSHTITNIEGPCTVEVFALYNEKISIGVIATTFTFEEPEDNIISIEEKTFSIYPNPANNEIYISSNEIIEEIVIYNISGQQAVINGQQSTQHTVINISNLTPGIYFIKVNTEKENIIKKFIKQ